MLGLGGFGWLVKLSGWIEGLGDYLFLLVLEKLPPYGRLFSNSCAGLQPSAANDGALRAPPLVNFFENFFSERMF